MIKKISEFVSGLSNNLQGAFWLFMSVFAFTGMASLAKYLGNDFHAFQIAFFRSSFSLIVILPFLLRAGLSQGGIKNKGTFASDNARRCKRDWNNIWILCHC